MFDTIGKPTYRLSDQVELTIDEIILILFCDWKLFRRMDWTQRSTICVQLTTLLLLLLLLVPVHHTTYSV